jgi:hypothetical protein
MLPQAILLGFTWYLSLLWLRQLRTDLGSGMQASIAIAATVNAIALIIYVTFLGTTEPIYEFMRRIGIYFGFLGMALVQLLVAVALLKTPLKSLAKGMLSISIVVFAIGILNLVLKATLADPDPAENRIEWIASVMMQAWFFVLFVAWRRTEAAFSVRIGPA